MNNIHVQIFGKWTLLVGINSILSIMLALGTVNQLPKLLGMIMGIFTFILIYSLIDTYLYEKKREEWRKSLVIGVIIKALLQFTFVVEIFSGIFATGVVQAIYPYSKNISHIDDFFYIYLTVIIDGILLSLVAGLITVIVKYIRKRFCKKPQEKMA